MLTCIVSISVIFGGTLFFYFSLIFYILGGIFNKQLLHLCLLDMR